LISLPSTLATCLASKKRCSGSRASFLISLKRSYPFGFPPVDRVTLRQRRRIRGPPPQFSLRSRGAVSDLFPRSRGGSRPPRSCVVLFLWRALLNSELQTFLHDTRNEMSMLELARALPKSRSRLCPYAPQLARSDHPCRLDANHLEPFGSSGVTSKPPPTMRKINAQGYAPEGQSGATARQQ
jgi:hypothetical protein